jgi:myb proto-oncogene protein
MEDELLTSLVDRFGTQTWTEIALRLQNRSGKQCRERWHNHLDPSIRKVSEMYIYIMYV